MTILEKEILLSELVSLWFLLNPEYDDGRYCPTSDEIYLLIKSVRIDILNSVFEMG